MQDRIIVPLIKRVRHGCTASLPTVLRIWEPVVNHFKSELIAFIIMSVITGFYLYII